MTEQTLEHWEKHDGYRGWIVVDYDPATGTIVAQSPNDPDERVTLPAPYAMFGHDEAES